jgi:hypothetical protein
MKKAKISEAALIEFYQYSEGLSSIEEFRAYCKNLIENAHIPNQQLLRHIDHMDRKRLTIAMNNFVFKGHGFGVIK